MWREGESGDRRRQSWSSHAVINAPHTQQAPFFRGITLTTNIALNKSMTATAIRDLFAAQYANEPLVRVLAADEGFGKDGIPVVRDQMNRHGVHVGGFTMSKDGKRVVVVATLDNLLKGAATQAMQVDGCAVELFMF